MLLAWIQTSRLVLVQTFLPQFQPIYDTMQKKVLFKNSSKNLLQKECQRFKKHAIIVSSPSMATQPNILYATQSWICLHSHCSMYHKETSAFDCNHNSETRHHSIFRKTPVDYAERFFLTRYAFFNFQMIVLARMARIIAMLWTRGDKKAQLAYDIIKALALWETREYTMSHHTNNGDCNRNWTNNNANRHLFCGPYVMGWSTTPNRILTRITNGL